MNGATHSAVLNPCDCFDNTVPVVRPGKESWKKMEEPADLSRAALSSVHARREIGGDKLAAALLLGIGKTTLCRKLKRYARDPTAPTAARICGALQHGIFFDLHK